MNKEKEIKKTIEKLNKYFVYAEKRLAIHEAAHVVFAYLVGHSCHYMQTGLQRDVTYRNGNLEIQAQSVSQIYNIFPPFLDKALQLTTVGYSIPQIASCINANSTLLTNEFKKHILVLLAGYEAESHFYDGIKYWFIKRTALKYSMDLTPTDFRNDNTKVTFLSKNVNLNSKSINTYKKLINIYLKDKIVKKTCFELAKVCLDKTKISQTEIEVIFSQTGFENIKQKLSTQLLNEL